LQPAGAAANLPAPGNRRATRSQRLPLAPLKFDPEERSRGGRSD